jgi:hypothetical protein
MKTNEKVEAIKYLKEIVVKYQKHAQYLYLTELISEFENETLDCTGAQSEMKEYLYKKCLPLIRAEKLDKLLGEES